MKQKNSVMQKPYEGGVIMWRVLVVLLTVVFVIVSYNKSREVIWTPVAYLHEPPEFDAYSIDSEYVFNFEGCVIRAEELKLIMASEVKSHDISVECITHSAAEALKEGRKALETGSGVLYVKR